jgi:hypothetical protein
MGAMSSESDGAAQRLDEAGGAEEQEKSLDPPRKGSSIAAAASNKIVPVSGDPNADLRVEKESLILAFNRGSSFRIEDIEHQIAHLRHMKWRDIICRVVGLFGIAFGGVLTILFFKPVYVLLGATDLAAGIALFLICKPAQSRAEITNLGVEIDSLLEDRRQIIEHGGEEMMRNEEITTNLTERVPSTPEKAEGLGMHERLDGMMSFYLTQLEKLQPKNRYNGASAPLLPAPPRIHLLVDLRDRIYFLS